jgi:hypothetical protein
VVRGLARQRAQSVRCGIGERFAPHQGCVQQGQKKTRVFIQGAPDAKPAPVRQAPATDTAKHRNDEAAWFEAARKRMSDGHRSGQGGSSRMLGSNAGQCMTNNPSWLGCLSISRMFKIAAPSYQHFAMSIFQCPQGLMAGRPIIRRHVLYAGCSRLSRPPSSLCIRFQ